VIKAAPWHLPSKKISRRLDFNKGWLIAAVGMNGMQCVWGYRQGDVIVITSPFF
jgi:hypothetical protein